MSQHKTQNITPPVISYSKVLPLFEYCIKFIEDHLEEGPYREVGDLNFRVKCYCDYLISDAIPTYVPPIGNKTEEFREGGVSLKTFTELEEVQNPHTIEGILKYCVQALTQNEASLVPVEIYEELKTISNMYTILDKKITDKKVILADTDVQILVKMKRELIAQLFQFLRDSLSPNKDAYTLLMMLLEHLGKLSFNQVGKMDIMNLSVVFAPNLIAVPSGIISEIEMNEIKKAIVATLIGAVHTILESGEKFIY